MRNEGKKQKNNRQTKGSFARFWMSPWWLGRQQPPLMPIKIQLYAAQMRTCQLIRKQPQQGKILQLIIITIYFLEGSQGENTSILREFECP